MGENLDDVTIAALAADYFAVGRARGQYFIDFCARSGVATSLECEVDCPMAEKISEYDSSKELTSRR